MSSYCASGIFQRILMRLFECLLITAAFGVFQSTGLRSKTLRTINAAPLLYGKWNKTVPYYIDSDIFIPEAQMIRQAIAAVVNGTNSVVTFTEVSPTDAQFKLKFTTLAGNPRMPQTNCSSDPGVNLALVKAGLTEQPVILARGPTGCLCTYCDLMRYTAMALGKMSEHNRGDRDRYITVINDNLASPERYVPYTSNQAYWESYEYDYCSATHNQRSDFAKPSLMAFSLPSTAPVDIPWLCQLSLTDCKLLTTMYHGDSTHCKQPMCAQQIEAAKASPIPRCAENINAAALPAPPIPTPSSPTPTTQTTTPTTPSTTPTTPTTTPTTPPTTQPQPPPPDTVPPPTSTPTTPATVPICSTAAFCGMSPDESISAHGPSPDAQYLLFSGGCLVVYSVDFQNRTIKALTSTIPIMTYFQGQGIPAFVWPVTLALITERLDSRNVYIDTMHLQNQNGMAVRCDSQYTPALNCSAEPAPTGFTGVIPTSVATSATSQYSADDGAMNHFVIDATGTKIRLTNSTMTTTYQPTTGSINLLTGQRTITKITAIQLALNGDTTISPYSSLFVVFGTGADGVTPYVGFVNMPAYGSSTVPLVPFRWIAEPKPLKTVLSGLLTGVCP